MGKLILKGHLYFSEEVNNLREKKFQPYQTPPTIETKEKMCNEKFASICHARESFGV